MDLDLVLDQSLSAPGKLDQVSRVLLCLHTAIEEQEIRRRDMGLSLHHPLLVLPIWYTDCKGTRNSLAGLVLLLHPSSSLGCPSCELHLSTKGTPRWPLNLQRLALPPAHLRTVSTPKSVSCPKCPNVS